MFVPNGNRALLMLITCNQCVLGQPDVSGDDILAQLQLRGGLLVESKEVGTICEHDGMNNMRCIEHRPHERDEKNDICFR